MRGSGDSVEAPRRRSRTRLASVFAALAAASLMVAAGAEATTAPSLIQDLLVSVSANKVIVSPALVPRGTIERILVANHGPKKKTVLVGGHQVVVAPHGHRTFILQFVLRGKYYVIVKGTPRLSTTLMVT